ncbi:transposase [Xenorhabdus sp. M]|uniref:Transposase n=1 Tax=Xenorhabdus szentirmaii TaxID=290112 RepID=A0AAW3YWR1_9GAMM|nr:transposase [Xenorhabdus sp. M]
MIYTTNVIESPNSTIRHTIKKHNIFPSDGSVKKILWRVIQKSVYKSKRD